MSDLFLRPLGETDKRSLASFVRVGLLSFICLVLLFWAAALEGVKTKTINVGVYENNPKVFTSQSGEPAGFFVDIIEEIAKQEDWKVHYVSGTWDEGLARLSKGEIDLMPDVAYNSEREQIYAFHKIPVLSSWSQVFARKGSGIHSILDMNGMRIAVLAGSVQQTAFEGLAKSFGLSFELIPYPTFEKAFEAVIQKKADAALTNNLYGLAHARKVGLEDTAVVFSPSTLFFAASKHADPSLLSAIDIHLAALKKDIQSEYYKSLNRWTSEKVKFAIPLWIQMLAAFIAVAFTASIIIVFVFKRLLKIRTQELRKTNIEMEERIIERTWALEEAMERAKDADRLKSAFLATMSHELRTPLNSIIGFTGILLQGLAGSLNEEQKKQLGMVQNSSRHLLSLINDVLDISKIEAGQLDLFYESFDLRQSIEKVTKLILHLMEKKGLEFRSEIETSIATVYCDQRRLEQIMLNLLSNAVKFTNTGYVKISAWQENEHCWISVKDSGIGMEEDELKKLFVPFSQIDSGLTRKYEGTGLGLSICKKLIALLEGTIQVASKTGKGSTFTISFPITTER